jgi:NAD+ dependent glucose-6-phosphate dehydrogenase
VSRILITGAAGNIGSKLGRAFAEDGHELVLLDVVGGERIHAVDLRDWNGCWRQLFEGVDYVLHLAGTPEPAAPWRTVQELNFDLTFNVFEAAAQSQVKRLVFASSNWVLSGHRGEGESLSSATEPAPLNAYAVSKLMGERLGRFYGMVRGMSVISFRIGHCQRLAGNQPGPHVVSGLWGQRMWLSDRDLYQGFAKALAAPTELPFATLNLVSDNAGMRWDLSEAEAAIGYRPQDSSRPEVTEAMVQREEAVARIRSTIRDLETLLSDQRW